MNASVVFHDQELCDYLACTMTDHTFSLPDYFPRRIAMRHATLVLLTVLFSQQALAADMTTEERCTAQGDIAKQASQMRLDGKDMNKAMETLRKADKTGLSEDKINGAVRLSYMAKMKPDSMRKYFISECKKDILR